jgi:hypothetical protein
MLDKNIIRIYNLKAEKAATLNGFKSANRFLAALTDKTITKYVTKSHKGEIEETEEESSRNSFLDQLWMNSQLTTTP